MTAGERVECWAVGARVRSDLQRIVETADKLVSLTVPGDHDPLEVAARERELGRLVEAIHRDADDSVACGVPAPSEDTRANPGHETQTGSAARTWIRDWLIYGEKLMKTPDPHARAVALSKQVRHVVAALGWETNEIQRPGGSPPQGQVTLKMGPRGSYLFTPQTEEDLETAKDLGEFLSGGAKRERGVEIATHLYRDGALDPSLSDALGHLRSVLSAVTIDADTHVLILWSADARVLEVAGYTDPYRGQTWAVQVTPNYTVQNQREIADYVRHYEGAIADEVRRLAPRKQRRAGWSVEFFTTHPGVQYAKHIEVGPPEDNRSYGYMLPDFHPEDSYTPIDYDAPPAKPLFR